MSKEWQKYEGRWQSPEGHSIQETILAMIRHGAGEDFLQWDFEQGKFPFLEDYADLKGITIFQETIEFPVADNFEAIDFSYASFYHSKFTNAGFVSSYFGFSKIYNCEFVNCHLSFTNFYGTTFEKVKFINCTFGEHNKFTNCDFINTSFENCFTPYCLFFDCRFNETTSIGEFRRHPERGPKDLELADKDLAEVYRGIKDGYTAGDTANKADIYFIKMKQALTRHNSHTKGQKILRFALEWTTGYGIKPLRVLATMLLTITIFAIPFSAKIGFKDGTLLSVGAFFTFGAFTEYLRTFGPILIVLYIVQAFMGISLTALLVTVLANKWFRDR